VDPAESAIKGEQMAIKNRKDNDLTLLYRVWVFGFVLAFASLFGFFVAMVFGVAPLLLGLLAIGVFAGVGLIVLSSSLGEDLLLFPEEKPKKKRINSVGK